MIRCAIQSTQISVRLTAQALVHSLVIALASTACFAQELSRTEIKLSVESIASIINENYFDIELANKIQSELLSKLRDGSYNQHRAAKKLSDVITADLYKLTKDKHLVVWLQRVQPTKNTEDAFDEKKATAEREAKRAVEGKKVQFWNSKI